MAKGKSGTAAHNVRIKAAFQLAFHVPFWGLVLLTITVLKKTDAFLSIGRTGKLAAVVGLAVIGFGLIAAAFGSCAGYLEDSEEAEDMRRERPALLLGAGALVSSGSSLIVLVLAGAGALIPVVAGAIAAIMLSVLAALFVAVRYRRLDELNRGVARDAGYFAFTCLSWVGGTWAILAHLGFVAAPDALGWLTMIHGFSFVAGLVAFARKGGFENPSAA
jgi:hypothetical protein